MIYNPFSLQGKTIFITGASSGIGKAIAVECAKMGATLIISARNEERLQSTLDELDGGPHTMLLGDNTNQDDISHIVEKLSVINGMVLCAGKAVNLPIQFCERKSMDEIFDVNFFGNVEIIRLLYKKKKIAKSGSIVLLDSVGGITRFAPAGSIYGATKAALNSFMKFAAIEFANRNIRVNCICPGMVETPLIHRGSITEEQLVEDAKKYPLKRYGQPEDVAYAAVYLLSDASSWVTGTSIFVDGGLSII